MSFQLFVRVTAVTAISLYPVFRLYRDRQRSDIRFKNMDMVLLYFQDVPQKKAPLLEGRVKSSANILQLDPAFCSQDPNCHLVLTMRKCASLYRTAKDGVEDALPSTKLEQTLSQSMPEGSAGALRRARYLALYRTLGEERFTNAFVPLDLTQDGPLARLTWFTGKAIDGEERLQPGDCCYIQGVKHYRAKHPLGNGHGFHVVYSGRDNAGQAQFIVHGARELLTEKKIKERLLEDYNKERSADELLWIANQREALHYDAQSNPFLKNHYTIPSRAMDTFVVGLLPAHNSRFDQRAIALLASQNPEDTEWLLANAIPQARNIIKRIHERASQS